MVHAIKPRRIQFAPDSRTVHFMRGYFSEHGQSHHLSKPLHHIDRQEREVKQAKVRVLTNPLVE